MSSDAQNMDPAYDQDLVNRVSAKAGGQVHRVGNVITSYRYAAQFLGRFPNHEESRRSLIWGERVLRAFLVTGDIIESRRTVDADMKREQEGNE